MTQIQNEDEALLCTHRNCTALQTEDGEFCEKHYPKPIELIPYADDRDIRLLAHILTVNECNYKGIQVREYPENDEKEEYTKFAQRIYNNHYQLIISTLKV